MSEPPSTTEGYIPFPIAEKPCQTYYKVIGDLHSSTGITPLVALHGGPGINHDHLTILSDLGVPLVLYDQIGSGKSTRYPEKMGDTSFWTDDLFLSQLDTILTFLNIQINYDLIGHSWGGMLAARHAARQPLGLRRLVLLSAPVDMRLWAEAQVRLRERLPREVQDVMKRNEDAGTTASEEYQGAMGVFYSRHLCRLERMPEGLISALVELRKDPTVNLTMKGPSDFYITGPLGKWSIVDDAHKIKAPTLLINAEHDGAQDETVIPFFNNIPRVKWVKFANSSHMIHYEERERFMEEVKQFLSF